MSCKIGCGFGSVKRKTKGRKHSKKSKRMHKSRKGRKGSRKGSRKGLRFGSRRSRFGKIGGLNYIMGNTPSNQMSLDQNYVGNSPNQQTNHMNNVDPDLVSNFYRNV